MHNVKRASALRRYPVRFPAPQCWRRAELAAYALTEKCRRRVLDMARIEKIVDIFLQGEQYVDECAYCRVALKAIDGLRCGTFGEKCCSKACAVKVPCLDNFHF